jgi:hypothetical protein
MFVSDNWLVPYAGYDIGIPASALGGGTEGRSLSTIIKLQRMIGIFNSNVYLINITFNQKTLRVTASQAIKIGELQTSTGIVYIATNNKPQILLSDLTTLYIYDPTLTPNFQVVPTSFIPGFIDFHDTYFLCAASSDTYYTPPANNTWRLSAQSNGLVWPNDSASIGFLQTKSDNTQAILRFPGKGNMIFVFGGTVVEPWFDVGYQLFPYQRSTSFNIDYGTINPATIASMDGIVAWLGINEKAGPVVFYSRGDAPDQITTDGFDYVLANMQNPADSRAFMYRQDGHLFYHINFYTDNLSFFVDFLKDGSHKIYHACDENMNYFIASSVAFFNNQYYFVSKNNGNLYTFDTVFTHYSGREIPQIRTCKNIRNIKQEPFIVTDCGFTIESGNTNYLPQNLGAIYLTTQDKYAHHYNLSTQNHKRLITQDGKCLITQQINPCDIYYEKPKKYITEGSVIFLVTQDGNYLVTQDDYNLIAQQSDPTDFNYLISQQDNIVQTVPRVDMSISIDGGEHFSSYDAQYLPPIGHRINKLTWWQLGWANDFVAQYRFSGIGRFIVTDGVVNTEQ